MKRSLFSLIIACIALPAFAQQKWDLKKCIDHAMTNNITVKQAQAQAKLSLLTYTQSKMTRIPTLEGSANVSYQHGLNENPTTGTLESADFVSGNINLQAGYTIFNWGARKSNIEADNFYAKADAMGVDRAKNDIALLVANAFLQVMLRREQVRTSDLQLLQSRAQLENTRKLVKAGSQPELNSIQIEAQMARDTATLLQAQSLEQQGLITLKAYLNLDLATPFDIEAPDIDKIPMDNIIDLQPEAVYAIAVTTQPVQQMYALRLKGASSQVKAAKASLYPTLSGFGSLTSRYINAKSFNVIGYQLNQPTGAVVIDGLGNTYNVLAPKAVFEEKAVPFFTQLNNNFGQALGLSVNFPIFNQYVNRAQWQRAKINVEQTQLQDEQEKLNLKTNIYNAYQDAFASLQKYNASVRSVEASEKAFNISKKRFDIGLLGTLDYIITQGNVYRAKIESISNKYDYIFKMKVLEFYKGQGIRL